MSARWREPKPTNQLTSQPTAPDCSLTSNSSISAWLAPDVAFSASCFSLPSISSPADSWTTPARQFQRSSTTSRNGRIGPGAGKTAPGQEQLEDDRNAAYLGGQHLAPNATWRCRHPLLRWLLPVSFKPMTESSMIEILAPLIAGFPPFGRQYIIVSPGAPAWDVVPVKPTKLSPQSPVTSYTARNSFLLANAAPGQLCLLPRSQDEDRFTLARSAPDDRQCAAVGRVKGTLRCTLTERPTGADGGGNRQATRVPSEKKIEVSGCVPCRKRVGGRWEGLGCCPGQFGRLVII
jgi:hypothetical protein